MLLIFFNGDHSTFMFMLGGFACHVRMFILDACLAMCYCRKVTGGSTEGGLLMP